MGDGDERRSAWLKTTRIAAIAVAAIVLTGCNSLKQKAALDAGKTAEVAKSATAAPADDAAIVAIETGSVPESDPDAALNALISEALSTVAVEKPARTVGGVTHRGPAGSVYQVMTFDDLPGWNIDDHGAALIAFRRSCRTLRRLDRTTTLGGLASRISDWRPSCDAAETVSKDSAKRFFELAFAPVRITPRKAGRAEALITAYYEPEIAASRTRAGAFRTPLYAKPPELVSRGGAFGVVTGGRLRPFASRAAIDGGALAGRGLEIAYLADPVDAFFLQIQGSGRLRFQNGDTARVAFAAKNGHPYRSVAQAMIKRGLATRNTASAGHIKAYVRKNPKNGRTLLHANPSYVFFRLIDGLDKNAGPVGALGVQLTARRSIAVDRRYTPLAAPVWLETRNSPAGPMARLVIAQDTGAAIKGPQRADFFWGTGAAAGKSAGRMRHKGRLTVLLPTATVRRLAQR